MKRGHVPERTCRGCGRRFPRPGLRRFVVIEDVLVEDQQGVMPGRGMYCCGDALCRVRLEKNGKKLKRGLRSRALRVNEEGDN